MRGLCKKTLLMKIIFFKKFKKNEKRNFLLIHVKKIYFPTLYAIKHFLPKKNYRPLEHGIQNSVPEKHRIGLTNYGTK